MARERDHSGVQLEDSINSLVSFSEFAASGNEGKLRIYSGELHCEVYDNDRVIEAFKAAYAQGVLIQIIAGPILSVREETRYSRIIELAQPHSSSVVELYFRSKRLDDSHHYIAFHNGYKPDWKIRVENPHEALAPSEERSLIDVPEHKAQAWAARFDDRIRNGGDESCEIRRSCNPMEDFLLMTPSEIRATQALTKQLFPDFLKYNSLTKERLEKLLQYVQTQQPTNVSPTAQRPTPSPMTQTPTTADVADSATLEPSTKSSSQERGLSMSRWKIISENLWNRSALSHPFLSVAKTLKLMVLVLWYSLRYPLTESTIDYEKGEVYNKPHA